MGVNWRACGHSVWTASRLSPPSVGRSSSQGRVQVSRGSLFPGGRLGGGGAATWLEPVCTDAVDGSL